MSLYPASGPNRAAPPGTYCVLDDDDRIAYVHGTDAELWSRLGRMLWDHLPGAAQVYGPIFDEARAGGRSVESTVFYANRVRRVTAVPGADGLRVEVECLEELDVTTLGTLAESLRRVGRELAARESGRLDPPAPSSLRALP